MPPPSAYVGRAVGGRGFHFIAFEPALNFARYRNKYCDLLSCAFLFVLLLAMRAQVMILSTH
jgi:hypothetical protein